MLTMSQWDTGSHWNKYKSINGLLKGKYSENKTREHQLEHCWQVLYEILLLLHQPVQRLAP